MALGAGRCCLACAKNQLSNLHAQDFDWAGGVVGLRVPLIRPALLKKAARGDFDYQVRFALLMEVGGMMWISIGPAVLSDYAALIRPTLHPHKSVDVKKAAQGDFDYCVTSAPLVEVSGS